MLEYLNIYFSEFEKEKEEEIVNEELVKEEIVKEEIVKEEIVKEKTLFFHDFLYKCLALILQKI